MKTNEEKHPEDYLFKKVSIAMPKGHIEEGLVIEDDEGYLISREEALKIIDKLNMFYKRETKSVNDYIYKVNFEYEYYEKGIIFSMKTKSSDILRIKRL